MLVARRWGPVLAATMRSSLEARASAFAVLLTLGVLFTALGMHRSLAHKALDASMDPVALLEDFGFARSPSARWPPASTVTVIVRAESVHLLGGPRFDTTDRVEGSEPWHEALGGILADIFEQRRRRRVSSPRGEQLVVAGIPIPREEDFVPETVSVAAEGAVPFGRVMQTIDAVRAAGVPDLGLLVASDGPLPDLRAARAEIRRGVIPFAGPHASWLHGHHVELRRPRPPSETGVRDILGLGLLVVASEQGLHLRALGGALPEGCWRPEDPSAPTIEVLEEAEDCAISEGNVPPACAYDFVQLRQCLTRILETYPEERQVQVGAASTVSYQVVVRVLDECATGVEPRPFGLLDAPFRVVLMPDSAGGSGLELLPSLEVPGPDPR